MEKPGGLYSPWGHKSRKQLSDSTTTTTIAILNTFGIHTMCVSKIYGHLFFMVWILSIHNVSLELKIIEDHF